MTCSQWFVTITAMLVLLSVPRAAEASSPCTSQTSNAAGCTIFIDTSQPIVPQAIHVKGGTTVHVVVKRRPNEKVKFLPKTEAIARPDFLGALISGSIGNLTTLALPLGNYQTAAGLGILPPAAIDVIGSWLKAIKDSQDTQHDALIAFDQELRSVERRVNSIGSELESLPAGAATAAPFLAASDAIKTLLDTRIEERTKEAKSQITANDAKIDSVYELVVKTKWDQLTPEQQRVVIDGLGELRYRQSEMKDEVSELSERAAALKPAAKSIAAAAAYSAQADRNLTNVRNSQMAPFADAATWQAGDLYEARADENHKVTVSISTVDLLDPTKSADIATIVITFQDQPWELSTGAIFSPMPRRSFNNTPQFENGQVKVVNGSQVSVLTENDTLPTVVFPFFLGHRRLGNDFQWMGHGSAVLLSGGAGVNLATKTAEFGTGLSLRWGSVYLTPLLHLGHETRLDSGVLLNKSLGVDPPAPPTHTEQKMKFAIGLTYRVSF